MILFIKLFLSHLLGDFLFQPNSWVKAKEKNKLMAWQVYAHAFIHFSTIMMLVWDLSFILWAIALALFHLVTDIAKVYLQSENTKSIWFFTDQIIHFIIIATVTVLYQNITIDYSELLNEYNLILVTFVYTLTQPASATIRFLISKWTIKTDTESNGSLENAGKYIGMLERLFVFAFIVSNNWQAIGFLLAAKSVFRFGDLKDSKDRKLTEYVMIGTLLSFGIALLLGIIFTRLF